MYDFRRLATVACAAERGEGLYQLERTDMLAQAERVTITEPEHDDTGRFWFFICGTVRGEPLAVPHVVGRPDCRVLEPSALARAYRAGILSELERRGFRVSRVPNERGAL